MTVEPTNIDNQKTCRLCIDPFDTPASQTSNLLSSGFTGILMLCIGVVLLYAAVQERTLWGLVGGLVALGLGGLMLWFAGKPDDKASGPLCVTHLERLTGDRSSTEIND